MVAFCDDLDVQQTAGVWAAAASWFPIADSAFIVKFMEEARRDFDHCEQAAPSWLRVDGVVQLTWPGVAWDTESVAGWFGHATERER